METGLQEILEQLLEEQGVPGISAAYTKGNDEFVAAAVGLADRITGEPFTPQSRSFSGSVGKTFTAAVALQLLEEKSIDIDEWVAPWLKRERWYDGLAVSLLEGVTFRMLLQHTSGLNDYVFSRRFQIDLMWRRLFRSGALPYAPEDLIRIGLRQTPSASDRGKFKYGDTGYLILGKLIERISGEGYYDRLQRIFLEPLALRSIESNRALPIGNLVSGHLELFNRFLLPRRAVLDGRSSLKPGSEWTGGGLVGTATDFARWIHWLVAKKGLGESASSAMRETVATEKEGSRYGLGLRVEDSALGVAVGHYGWYPGYRSIAWHYEEKGISVAILVNTDVGARMRAMADRIVEGVFEG